MLTQFFAIDSAARLYPGSTLVKNIRQGWIGNLHIRIEYRSTNRNDLRDTPTRRIYIDDRLTEWVDVVRLLQEAQ